jgi:hypothetical protein
MEKPLDLSALRSRFQKINLRYLFRNRQFLSMTTFSAREYPEGHADFSAYIAIDPDLEIFRRFTKLSARNLLYLQSELASLEAWFDDFDREDELKILHASQGEKMDISLRNRNWESFVVMAETDSNPDPGEEEKRQASKMKQVMKLRRVIGEYRIRHSFQHGKLVD